MDVSENNMPDGQDLIEKLVSLTGLPPNLAHGQIDEILQMAGQSPGNVTLDQLREAMLNYLESMVPEEEVSTSVSE
ncbi:MAG: hypothetical protein AABZ55_15665 [Bdellovibrionota bacterium]